MGFNYDDVGGDDWDPTRIGESKMPKPGRAHLLVTDIQEADSQWKVRLEIGGHDDENQVGREVYDYLPTAGKGLPKTISFGLAAGAFTRQDLANSKAHPGSVDPEQMLPQALGNTVCTRLQENEYKGRISVRPGFTFFAPNDPDVEDWPVNKDVPNATAKPQAATPANVAVDDKDIPF